MSTQMVSLRLDHASVVVPDLGAAVDHLDRRLGLRATVSPEAPERHSRVYLDRSYLEVSAEPEDAGWNANLFFLRFDDPNALRAHLDGVAIAYRFSEYVGLDGTWDDVEIRAGDVPLPLLIRRTAPEAVARDWPPPLTLPHRSGARTLAAVHVGVPSLEEAIEAYRKLLGSRVSAPDETRRTASARLTSGRIVLRESLSGKGYGLALGVPSLASTRAALDRRLALADDGVAWIDPEETFGLRLGFAEL